MLAIFRKIRRSLLETSSTKKYILYAIGEILLIMIGILLALQVNNWNESRKESAFEREILLQLKTELEADLDMMNQNREYVLGALDKIGRIIHHLKYEQSYPDSILSDFAILMRGRAFVFKTSAIKTLESKGIDFVENRNLRNQIIELYSNWYPAVEGIMENYYVNLDSFFRPLVRSRFIFPDDVSSSRAIRPVDFVSLKSDLGFNNAVRVAKSNYTAKLDRFDNAILAVKNLIGSIEEEVGKK